MIGSNAFVFDFAGVLRHRSSFYPYGKTLAKAGFSDVDLRYTFTGKEDDGRLMYFGARYYDPRVGRFSSLDAKGDAYAYAKDNPLKFNDPDGNEPSIGQLRLVNIGIGVVPTLLRGLWERNSAGDITKNVLAASLAGAADFEIKRGIARNGINPAYSLGADIANSVRENAMQNRRLDRVHLNLFSPLSVDVGGGSDAGLSIDAGKALDVISLGAYAATNAGGIDVRQSLLSLRPAFTMRDRIDVGWGEWGGFPGMLGGGAAMYARNVPASERAHNFLEEPTHMVQYGSDIPSFGRGIGLKKGLFGRDTGILDFSGLKSNLLFQASSAGYIGATGGYSDPAFIYRRMPTEVEGKKLVGG